MPDARQNVDQGLFEEAIAEVKRLEGLVVPRKEEKTKEAFGQGLLFEEKDLLRISATSFDSALEDALRLEGKLGVAAGRAAPARVPQAPARAAPVQGYDEERNRKEQEELEKMKSKFARIEEEKAAAAKAEAKKAPEKPPVEEEPQKETVEKAVEPLPAVPRAQPRPAPVRAVPAANEEEQVRMMRERLEKVMGKGAAPVPIPAAVQKRTLFERLEEKRKAGVPDVPEPVAGQPVAAKGEGAKPRALNPLEAQLEDERRRKEQIEMERAKALKEAIAKKVTGRMAEEEKRKKEERLMKEIDDEMKDED